MQAIILRSILALALAGQADAPADAAATSSSESAQKTPSPGASCLAEALQRGERLGLTDAWTCAFAWAQDYAEHRGSGPSSGKVGALTDVARATLEGSRTIEQSWRRHIEAKSRSLEEGSSRWADFVRDFGVTPKRLAKCAEQMGQQQVDSARSRGFSLKLLNVMGLNKHCTLKALMPEYFASKQADGDAP